MSFIGDLERFFGQVIWPQRGLVIAVVAVGVLLIVLAAWRLGWGAPLRRHPRRTLVVAAVALLLAAPLGWYLASPLFIRTQLVEAMPPGVAVAADHSDALLVGEFRGADDFHTGGGTVAVIDQGDGTYLVRFEDFSVLNGPDLHVYVSPSSDGYVAGAYDIGRLKATDGSFNYLLTAGTDPERLGSIVIWCEPFGVQFAHAPLAPPRQVQLR